MKSASNIREIIAFLRQLAINNDRTWFKARKDRYDALRAPWEQDMERLIGLVADFDPQARGLAVKDSVYRIYRDIRFSHDKSPYKTYFSGVIGKGGRHTVQSCYSASSTLSPRSSSPSSTTPRSPAATSGCRSRSSRCPRGTPRTIPWRNTSR